MISNLNHFELVFSEKKSEKIGNRCADGHSADDSSLFCSIFAVKACRNCLKRKKNGSGLSYITYTFIPLQFLGYFKLLEPFTNDKHHKTSQKLSHLKLRKVHSPKLI